MASLESNDFETQHVHKVYKAIAKHFSATRYKPWPVVDNFLRTLPIGSLGADVGCGNGKYLGVNKDVYIVGSDRCFELCKISAEKGYEAMVCDGCSLSYKSDTFDFVISIAVIHHFSSPERRLVAIKELLRIAKPGAKILIFVWALEQTKNSKRKFEEQDVFVTWNMPKSAQNQQDTPTDNGPEVDVTPPGDKIYKRYYHLFKEGELDSLVEQTNEAKIIQTGYDRDNWFVIAQKS